MWTRTDAEQPLIGVGLCNIADVELQRSNPQEAAALAREGLQRIEAAEGPGHRHVGFAASVLGRAELALGKPEVAQPLLRRGLKILTETKADANVMGDVQLGLAEAIVAAEDSASEASALAAAAQLRYEESGNDKGAKAAAALVTRLRE